MINRVHDINFSLDFIVHTVAGDGLENMDFIAASTFGVSRIFIDEKYVTMHVSNRISIDWSISTSEE